MTIPAVTVSMVAAQEGRRGHSPSHHLIQYCRQLPQTIPPPRQSPGLAAAGTLVGMHNRLHKMAREAQICYRGYISDS